MCAHGRIVVGHGLLQRQLEFRKRGETRLGLRRQGAGSGTTVRIGRVELEWDEGE